MTKLIGIDLGTTNSCVYVLEGERPIAIPNREGRRTTLSMVAFTAKGERLVGTPAQRQCITNPAGTIFAVKRLIGRKYDSEEVSRLREVCPFAIVPAPNGDAWVRVGDRECSPPEISAAVLGYLKTIAEEYLGEKVTEAVVTVPAFFNDCQRQATKDAAKMAGLEIRRILNEPTAAALAYGAHEGQSQRVAVFDLGGGTFDISILNVSDGVFEVLASCGDTFLGGDDLDQALVAFLADDFQKKTDIDLRKDPVAMQRLKEAAQTAKHELSETLTTGINLPFLTAQDGEPVHLLVDNLSRAQLEALAAPMLDRLEKPCQMALQDAKLNASDIDQVLLVGGMTRMPAVQQRVEEIFGRPPTKKDVDPDEIVAMGATLEGCIMRGELENVVLLDVTPHSLGLRVRGGRFSKIINRNTRIPAREKKIFAPVEKHQNFVVLEIYQGESDRVGENEYLGKFTLKDLPTAETEPVHVEVSFTMDADGLLNVSAVELKSGKAASMQVQPSGGLTDEQIARIMAEAAGGD